MRLIIYFLAITLMSYRILMLYIVFQKLINCDNVTFFLFFAILCLWRCEDYIYAFAQKGIYFELIIKLIIIKQHHYSRFFLKVSPSEVHISTYCSGFICLPGAYLNSSIVSDDGNLKISSYDLRRAGHPSKQTRRCKCVCYKISLSLRPLDICYLHECNVFELKTRKKICKFVMFCRSPSLSEDEFETFTGKLELTLDKALIKILS